MLKYLIQKEFLQIFRDTFLPKLLAFFPLMVMLILPWVATLDIHHIKVAVVDKDKSVVSQRLINKIDASDYFSVKKIENFFADAMDDMERDHADLIIEIPEHFSDNLAKAASAGNSGSSSSSASSAVKACQVLISANAVNGTKGLLGSSYMSQLVSEFNSELENESGYAQPSPVTVSVVNLYNPTLNYRQFMIPAFISVLILMLCGFLPALNIVNEKEVGTIEQINVTPVKKTQFILAKLIPYWTIGFSTMIVCFLIAWLVYGYVAAGSYFTIFAFAFIFILFISSVGLLVSNISETVQQAILVMFFIMVIFALMTGLFTPVRSMPEWAQTVAAFLPPTYFIEVMRGVYQRGSGFSDLLPQLYALLSFASIFGTAAILSYRKRS